MGASPSTWAIDEEIKASIYAGTEVAGYFHCDPHLDRGLLPARLNGRRLWCRAFEDLPIMHHPDGSVVVHGEMLELDLLLDGDRLCLWGANQGRFISAEDVAQGREVAESDRTEPAVD